MDGAAGSLLTLPRLHAGIPTAPIIDEGQGGVRLFAEALVHAAVLQARHLDATPELRQAMDAAMQEWLAPYHRQLEIFRTVACGYTSDLTVGDRDEFRPQPILVAKPAAFLVSNNNEERESRYIGKTATALEAQRPGLGRQLMILLHMAGTHGLGMHDPQSAYYEAQHHFWHGETDMRFVAENLRDAQEDARLRKAGEPVPTDE